MAANLVAIDIGSSQMKFAVGKAGGRKIILKKQFSIVTPENAINNGEIVDAGLMREALTVAVKNNKLAGKRAAVTIQSSTFISRDFTIPKLKEKDVASALRFEIEQFMPVMMDDYVFNYRELERSLDPEHIGRQRVKYLVGMMPRRIVDMYYTILKAVKLKPISMDVNANAVEKLLNFDKAGSEGVLLVADIGNDAMDMTVFENGQPQVNRTVPLGGSEITRSIASTFGLDLTEAERKKIQDVNLSARSDALRDEAAGVNDVARSVMSDWAEQIRRMIEFYRTRNQGAGIDRVYIYGGSSALSGLVEYLNRVFGLPVSILEAPDNVKCKDASAAAPYTFLNAIGAMIRR